jgi:catechol 2,3-dioxygenase-like lactoylglutathione lyase family enzyme
MDVGTDMDWKLVVVVVPVADIDRAKRFYQEQVGFRLDHDTRVSAAVRIVKLTPPGSECAIVLREGLPQPPPGSLVGLHLVVPDVDAARVHLMRRGVDVSPVSRMEDGAWKHGRGGPWNAFVFFADPDGNEWTVQEQPTA